MADKSESDGRTDDMLEVLSTVPLRGNLFYLPGHESAQGSPGGFANAEAHQGVCEGIPSSAHKQDDGSIERAHLE